MVRTLSCGPYTVDLFAAGNSQTVVYAVMDQTEAQAVWSMLKEPKPALAVTSGVDWNRELSPWPAPGVFRGGGDFSGEGPAFLDMLTGQDRPGDRSAYGACPAVLPALIWSSAALRIVLCLFPQNNRFRPEGNLTWGVYRNLPFAVTGLCLVILFFLSGNTGGYGLWPMSIAIEEFEYAQRVGNPLDIANMVLYLCSDKAGFITGENICIDGGMTRQMICHNDFGWKLEE